MWDPGWDNIFSKKKWGKYPPEELVRFVGRNYFSVPDRSSISFLEIGCGGGAVKGRVNSYQCGGVKVYHSG
jgi:hypothetical protein